MPVERALPPAETLPPTEAAPSAVDGQAGRPGWARLALAGVPVAGFALLALLLLARLGGGDPATLPSALIGRPAPAMRLDPLPGLGRGGRPVPGLATADLKGRVSVVNIFASWCGPAATRRPCWRSLPPRSRPGGRRAGPARRHRLQDDPDNARRFLGEFGNPYEAVGADTTGRAAIDWGVYGVPETFVVAPDGTIAFQAGGPARRGQPGHDAAAPGRGRGAAALGHQRGTESAMILPRVILH